MTWDTRVDPRVAEAALRVRENREREAAFAQAQQEKNMARTKAPQGDCYKVDLDLDGIDSGMAGVQAVADAALDAMAAAQEREAQLARMDAANREATAARFNRAETPR